MVFLSVFFIFSCSCSKHKEIKQYSVDQFYQNNRIYGGEFSPDESKLLISSNKSGIFNLYEITISDGSKRQVTNSTVESYYAHGYVPETGEMCYSADKGETRYLIYIC